MIPETKKPELLIFAELKQDQRAGDIPLPSGIAMRIDQRGTTYQMPSPFRGDTNDIILHTEKPRLIDTSKQKSTVAQVVESVRDIFRKIFNLNT